MARTFRRYLWFQIPGWIAAALVVSIAVFSFGLPKWAAVVLWAAWVAKDFLLYPLVRKAYAPTRPVLDELIGAEATVQNVDGSVAYVRVRGELWRAKLRTGGEPLKPGDHARVSATEGMTLIITRA